jgi:hypothetical protein
VVTEGGVVEGAGLEAGVVAGAEVWLGGACVCARVDEGPADRDGLGGGVELGGRVELGDGDDGRTVDGLTAGTGAVGVEVTAGWTGAAGADGGRTRM